MIWKITFTSWEMTAFPPESSAEENFSSLLSSSLHLARPHGCRPPLGQLMWWRRAAPAPSPLAFAEMHLIFSGLWHLVNTVWTSMDCVWAIWKHARLRSVISPVSEWTYILGLSVLLLRKSLLVWLASEAAALSVKVEQAHVVYFLPGTGLTALKVHSHINTWIIQAIQLSLSPTTSEALGISVMNIKYAFSSDEMTDIKTWGMTILPQGGGGESHFWLNIWSCLTFSPETALEGWS